MLTDDEAFALEAVANQYVVHHRSTEPHGEGFSWLSTDMTEETEQACESLHRKGLIYLDTHRPWGSRAKLTFEGSEALCEWIVTQHKETA